MEVKAAGVNPVDTYIRSGGNGYSVSLPYTPGADGAGVVVDAPAPSAFKPGDRVYFAGTLTGSYASHALAKEVPSTQLHPQPGRGQLLIVRVVCRACRARAEPTPSAT